MQNYRSHFERRSMSSHLIYHPQRVRTAFNGVTVYHDQTHGNQDPYIWNDPFLHTFCHMPELRAPGPGEINFWISGDSLQGFKHLCCDLVFVIKEKLYWPKANSINRNDQIVDSKEAFHDHYQWAWQHRFEKKRRFTLKANSALSFQYQDRTGSLINIIPILNDLGFSTAYLRKALKKNGRSKPMRLDLRIARELHSAISTAADFKLSAKRLQSIRKDHPELASQSKRIKRC